MVSAVWYPTNYYRLSFGKQDRLSLIANQVGIYTGLHINSNRQEVIRAVQRCLTIEPEIAREIQSLGNYVPYRFLRPFFAQHLRGMNDWQIDRNIERLAEQTFTDPQNLPLYRFTGHPIFAIVIQEEWYAYLNQNLAILTDFCLWNLVNYIQKKNPNIPNIPNKLFEPEHRDLSRARAFWNLVFDQQGGLSCIYSGQMIDKHNFSLDHFLPWRFVAHDLLWNIIPTIKSVNSRKSDNLPDMTHYFEPFADLQFRGVQIVIQASKPYLLEDYFSLLGIGSIDEIRRTSFMNFREKLSNAIVPQYQIAVNMGFSSHWLYL